MRKKCLLCFNWFCKANNYHNVNAKHSQNPVHFCCIEGNMWGLEKLIQRGYSIYTLDYYGQDCLEIALMCKQYEIFRFLVRKDMNKEVAESFDYKKVLWLCCSPQIDPCLIDFLHESGVNVGMDLDMVQYNILLYSIRMDSIEHVKKSLKYVSWKKCPIVQLLRSDNLDILRLLYDHGVELPQQFNTFGHNVKFMNRWCVMENIAPLIVSQQKGQLFNPKTFDFRLFRVICRYI